MNIAQRIVLAVGLVGVVLMGLFPPWVERLDMQGVRYAKPLGYAAIFSTPQPTQTKRSEFYYVTVDVTRLAVQEGIAVVVMAGMMLLLKGRGGIGAARAVGDATVDCRQGRLSATPLGDPELLKLTGNVVASYVKVGIYTFADFVEQFARQIGRARILRVAPVVEDAWEQARAADAKLSATGKVADVLAGRPVFEGAFGPVRPDLVNLGTTPEARKLVEEIERSGADPALRKVTVRASRWGELLTARGVVGFFHPKIATLSADAIVTRAVRSLLFSSAVEEEMIPWAKVASYRHSRGIFWDGVTIESSGGSKALSVLASPKRDLERFVAALDNRLRCAGRSENAAALLRERSVAPPTDRD